MRRVPTGLTPYLVIFVAVLAATATVSPVVLAGGLSAAGDRSGPPPATHKTPDAIAGVPPSDGNHVHSSDEQGLLDRETAPARPAIASGPREYRVTAVDGSPGSTLRVSVPAAGRILGTTDGGVAGAGDEPTATVGATGPTVQPIANVTLVTGQTVRVLRIDNRTVYEIDAAVRIHRIETPEGTYIYPAGVDFGTYDPALFNIDLLIDQGFTDEETGSIPVIVTLNQSPHHPAPGTLSGGVTTMAGFDRQRELESIGAVAGRIAKDRPGHDGPTIDPLAVTRAPSIDRVYLDRVYSVQLNESREAISADAARRRYDLDGSNVTVAVLDTGVSTTHPDLDEGTVVDAKDFTTDGTVDDLVGHGTHVAAIIAGDGDASNGSYRGIAPDASIMNLRVLGGRATGQTSWIIDGIEYAIEHDADVLSISLGGIPRGDDPLVRGVQAATDAGVPVVVAGGNSGPAPQTIGSPAVAADVITVGAVDDATGDVAEFSSRGPTPIYGRVKPDLLAPGVGIISACPATAVWDCPHGEYTALNGTSMATPHVSGVVALLLERHPDWGPHRVKNALLSTADPIGPTTQDLTVYDQGTGVVNASRAVDPGIVVQNATVSFGTLQDNETATRTITVRNTGSRTRSLDVTNRVVGPNGTDRTAHVRVNRSRVVLAPGERTSIRIRVTATGSMGPYSGRLMLQGDQRTYTAVFGYVLAEQVVVEKRGIDNTSVDGDDVWVVPETSWIPGRTLEVENGTVTFPRTSDINYTVLTTGTDESTGQPVVLAGHVTGTHGIINESRTVAYRIDGRELRAEHGAMTNISFRAKLRMGPLNLIAVSVLSNFSETRTARFGYLNQPTDVVPRVSLEAIVVPREYHPGTESAGHHLDSPTVYHLLYTDALDDDGRRFLVNRSVLGREDRTYYRTRNGTEYDLLPVVWIDGTFSSDESYRWSLDGRVDQTVYVTADAGTFYTVLYRVQDEGPVREWPRSLDLTQTPPGEHRTMAIERPPYMPIVGMRFGAGWRVTSFFQRDQPPSLSIYTDPTVNNHLTVRIDGDRVATSSRPGYYTQLTGNDLPADAVLNATVETHNPGGLSSRTVTEYRSVDRGNGTVRPPGLADLNIRGLDESGTVTGDTVTIWINFTVTDQVTNLSVLYTTNESRTVPIRNGHIHDADEWHKATVTREGAVNFSVRFDRPDDADSLSLALLAVDGRDNTFGTAVFDAVHLGAGDDDGANDPNSTLATYTNENGVVTLAGLQRAVADWADGTIPIETLARVVRAWASGEPVT